MRYDCDYEGYEDCFIEVSESWTRGEIKRFYREDNKPEWFELIKSKIIAIHLTTTSGAIDSPDEFVDEEVDDLNFGIWQWVSYALMRGVEDSKKLGEAPALRWFAEQGKSTAAQTSQTQK